MIEQHQKLFQYSLLDKILVNVFSLNHSLSKLIFNFIFHNFMNSSYFTTTSNILARDVKLHSSTADSSFVKWIMI